jgi:putative aldouronate transport system substrate-binding protein
MFGSFGILHNAEHLQVINNVVTYTPNRPEFLNALRYFHRLHAEGLMDPEGFSQSNPQFVAKGRANPMVIGSFMGTNQANIVGIDRLPYYIPMPPLVGPRGDQLWNRARGTGVHIVHFTITNRCRSPETLIRWFDYTNSSLEMVATWEMGPVNMAWAFDPDGRWRNIMDNVPAGSSWGEFRHTIGVGAGGPAVALIWDWNNPVIRNIEDENTLNRIEAVQLQEPFLNPYIIPNGLEEVRVIQDRAILFTDIDTYIRTFVATSIMNGITDAQWQEHLRICERLNVTRYAQTFQGLFDRSRR